MHNQEGLVIINGYPEPNHDLKYLSRVMPDGRVYRIPDPNKLVIYLEEDCGLILFDAEFFRQIPEFARTHMDEGNPIINAMWQAQDFWSSQPVSDFGC